MNEPNDATTTLHDGETPGEACKHAYAPASPTTLRTYTPSLTSPASAAAIAAHPSATYERLRGNDALALLNEKIAEELERFEKDIGLIVATIKVVRDKEADTLKHVKAHVR